MSPAVARADDTAAASCLAGRESALAGGAIGALGLLAGVAVWRRRRRAP